MEDIIWGMLGSETVLSERRTRTLGLGPAVRRFNELAVPGIGGVWFGKQLFLALLGIAVNERIGKRRHCSNIQVSDALEALGCLLEYRHNGGERDSRLRGIDKLANAVWPPQFSVIGQRGFYVTQPMRMATVQALRELGLVSAEGQRFNSYRCSETGSAFLAACCGETRPHNLDPIEAAAQWVCGTVGAGTESMRKLLSPAEPLPAPARELLREILVRGDGDAAKRRRAVLDWTSAAIDGTAASVPEQVPSGHWHDLDAGAMFFAMRAAALSVLDAVEVRLAARSTHAMPVKDALSEQVGEAVQVLRDWAGRFLDHGFADATLTGVNAFARACVDESDWQVVEYLLKNDERVLRLRDGNVLPGPAFNRHARADSPALADEEDDAPHGSVIALPPFISYRVRNAWLMNLDLQGRLDAWLARESEQQ